jgi:hypothetical protein
MSEFENLQEEHPNDENSKSEEVSENISLEQTIEQPVTQNLKQETENMEVHHHPKVEKKNFKEYFLEFVMIFLAVTLGFFAENIRESVADSNREKEYVNSIIEDLKTDSANLHFIIYNYMPAINGWVDSSVSLLQSSNTINDRVIYQAIENATLWRHFNPNQRTLTQLKNSGNFILISDGKAIDGILDYDNRLNNYVGLNNTIRLYEHDVDTTQLRFTDYKIVRQIFNIQSKGKDFLSLTDVPNNARLTNFDNGNRKIFSNKLKQINIQEGIMLGQYEALYKESTELILLLKKEYHLQ